MYADDVILLSETPAGLQISLSHLQKYCTKWGLEVNTKKTKYLIFNNTGKHKSFCFWSLSTANILLTSLPYNNTGFTV
jgi:hypothetical protein